MLVPFLSLWPPAALAHDLWIVPGKFQLTPGEPTRVFISNGDLFPRSLTLLGEHRVVSLEIRSQQERKPIASFQVDGKALTFELIAPATDVVLVGLATRPRRARLKADDFTDYLELEGLDSIAALREELEESAQATVERYTKWAKAIIEVNSADEAVEESLWAQPLGHQIEIVPERNPNLARAGDALPVRVLFEGEGLSGASLLAASADDPAERLAAVTDDEGRASFTLPRAGRWFIRAIHMKRIEDDPQVQWESFWCSLTFEIQP